MAKKLWRIHVKVTGEATRWAYADSLEEADAIAQDFANNWKGLDCSELTRSVEGDVDPLEKVYPEHILNSEES